MHIKSSLTILILFCFFALSTLLQAQDGGPYTTDDNTLLLMHFDDNLSTLGSYSGNASNWGNNTSYEISLSQFDQCFRINNADGLQCILLDALPELNLGKNWTVEMWIKVGNYGTDAAEYPSIFIKDGEGMTAINIGFRKDGLGFTGEITFSDQSQLRIEQNNGIEFNLWHHVAFVSNSDEKEVSLTIHDENWLTVFSDSRSFPENTDGTLCTANRQMFIGGVDGSSNIQFDGWIDEFRISDIARDFSADLPDYPMQIETDHFQIFSSNEDSASLSLISDALEDECVELCSLWDRPMQTSILPEGKIKFYLLSRNEFKSYAQSKLPDWKCGWIDKESNIVYVTKPETSEQIDYYGDFESLSKGTLAQLLVHRKLKIKENILSEDYFLEGFGLYRGGYRPNRDLILQAITELGRLPEKSDILVTNSFNEGYIKDLITSFIECQLFNGISYQGITTWMQNDLWHPYLKNYYQKDEPERIKLQLSTTNFDIYGADQEIPYLNSIANRLEEKLVYYETAYDMDVENRFNVVIFPDEPTGMECMGYGDHYNGGSGCGGDKLDILSPIHFGGGIDEAMLSLIPHEFFHVFHNHMSPSPDQIVGFHAEGMAELMAYEENCEEYLSNRDWYIKDALNKFQAQYSREPKLEDIMPDKDGYMSVYTFGQAFWYYMHTHHADYPTIRDFFSRGLDWTVFDASYEEINAGYINYLKQLAGLTNIEVQSSELPSEFKLAQNYPNPFNPATTIEYSIPAEVKSQISKVKNISLKVFDILGRVVATIVNENQLPGNYNVTWNAKSQPSGIYFYKLSSDNFVQTRKMILLR